MMLLRYARVLRGRPCVAGDAWEWDGVRFSVLHPPAGFGASGNDGSCVLKVETAANALLVTGDIERRGESAVLAQGRGLAADVIVVPHHGSARSEKRCARAGAMPMKCG